MISVRLSPSLLPFLHFLIASLVSQDLMLFILSIDGAFQCFRGIVLQIQKNNMIVLWERKYKRGLASPVGNPQIQHFRSFSCPRRGRVEKAVMMIYLRILEGRGRSY